MLNHSVHRQKMLEIVQAIFNSKVGKYCAFKGGTLAYFIHNLDRFSTDVDLDLLDPSKEQEVLNHIEMIVKKIGNVKKSNKGKNLHLWVISYDEVSMNIKVELNKRIRESNGYEVVNIFGVDCMVMDSESIITNKLVALYERMANRDLYDVRFFLKKGREIKEHLVQERLGMNIKELIDAIIPKISKHFTKSNILHQMGLILSDKQKQEVKEHLIESTISLLEFTRCAEVENE